MELSSISDIGTPTVSHSIKQSQSFPKIDVEIETKKILKKMCSYGVQMNITQVGLLMYIESVDRTGQAQIQDVQNIPFVFFYIEGDFFSQNVFYLGSESFYEFHQILGFELKHRICTQAFRQISLYGPSKFLI